MGNIQELALERVIQEREETRAAMAAQAQHSGTVMRAGRSALESYRELVKRLPHDSEMRRIIQNALGGAMGAVEVALGEPSA